MSTQTILLIACIVLAFILLLIARLAVRWIIKLTMIGIIVIALLGGALIWWWTTKLAFKPTPQQQRSTPAKRANTR